MERIINLTYYALDQKYSKETIKFVLISVFRSFRILLSDILIHEIPAIRIDGFLSFYMKTNVIDTKIRKYMKRDYEHKAEHMAFLDGLRNVSKKNKKLYYNKLIED